MSHGQPIFSQIGPAPYTDRQRGPDSGFPPGRLHYWKAGWLRDLTDAAITTLLDPWTVCRRCRPRSAVSGCNTWAVPRPGSLRQPPHFAHRAEQYDMLILSQWADPVDSEPNIAWTWETFAVMEPHLADAVYVNNLGEEGQSRVQAAYGANYERPAWATGSAPELRADR
jgi:hypothetical protein